MKVDGFQGKPILMLCNKADVDEARDEVHIVNTLQVERLVNEARSKTITRVPFDILNLRIEKIHWGLGIRIVWIPTFFKNFIQIVWIQRAPPLFRY